MVEFEIGKGQRGLEAKNARSVASKITSQQTTGDKQVVEEEATPIVEDRFLNPYNFVRYLSEGELDEDMPANVRLMGRTTPPTHDRWVGLSGRITCRMQTITPLFISSSEGVKKERGAENKQHLSYQFFRVGDKKAVPASTIRGSVRSVFEAVTNSAFSNLGGERLSYRLSSNEMRKLVPGRLEKQEDGSWQVRLLPGYADFAPEKEQKRLYASPVALYDPVTRNRKHGDPPRKIDRSDDWQHRQPYWAVLREGSLGWRALALAESEKDAILKMNAIKPQTNKKLRVQHGYLCRTDQNTINKHSERFFYCDNSRNDVSEPLPVSSQVVDEYLDLIRDYQTRHADNVAKGVGPEPKRGRNLKFSRYVYKKEEGKKIIDGELVFAYLVRRDGKLLVHFLTPVSWPRVAYKRTIAELLPKHLHRDTDLTALDPASRMFGWVHGKGKESDGAYAGRVRFSHALLEKSGQQMQAKTLSILGSPKPTTTRFYLVDKKTKRPRNCRSEKQAGYDGNNQLRGRKFYRHFMPDEKHMTQSEKSDQNRTIRDAEGAGAVFTFNVEFENLASVELGALLWSLTLNNKGYHKVGYGKSLGLASVEIKAEKIELIDVQNRYRSLENDGIHPLPDEETENLVSTFRKAMFLRYSHVAKKEVLTTAIEKNNDVVWKIVFEDLPNVQDLLTIHDKIPPILPVHYPYSKAPRSQGAFEWFVGNTNTNGPKLELGLAVADKGLPFLTKDEGKRNRR